MGKDGDRTAERAEKGANDRGLVYFSSPGSGQLPRSVERSRILATYHFPRGLTFRQFGNSHVIPVPLLHVASSKTLSPAQCFAQSRCLIKMAAKMITRDHLRKKCFLPSKFPNTPPTFGPARALPLLYSINASLIAEQRI